MEITSLTITYTGGETWVLFINNTDTRWEAFYTGSGYNDMLAFKSKTGGNVINWVPYWVINYVDETDPENNLTPTSALELHKYLKQVGFFDDSSGGGGGVTTFLELEDVEDSSYIGKVDWIPSVNAGGTMSLKPITGLDQDNIDVKKYFTYNLGDRPSDILNKINRIHISAFDTNFPYIVGEKESIWFIGTTPNETTPNIIKYKMFNKGKGTYGNIGTGSGTAGTALTIDDIELVYKDIATLSDIEDIPTTVTIDFDPIVAPQTVSEWLNEQSEPIEIQSQDDGYTIFKGTVDGDEVSYLWIGTPGLYGVDEEQSTMDDFKLFGDEPVEAYYPKEDLPEDFFISCTFKPDGVDGRYMTYLTDDFRELDLQAVFPDVFPETHTVYATFNVLRNGNDIFISGQFDDNEGNMFVGSIIGAKRVNNVLTWESSGIKEVGGLNLNSSGDIASWHGAKYYNGYLYFSTRVNTSNNTPIIGVQIIKVNPYNLNEDVKILTLPATDEYRFTTTIDIVDNNIYALFFERTDPNVGKGNFVKISTNLDEYEIVFTAGYEQTKKIRFAAYFFIQNGEVFIPTVNNVDTDDKNNTIGLSVYSLTGKLKREKVLMQFTETGAAQPNVHWMVVRNGKVILSVTNHNSLLRINGGYGYDDDSIELEETKVFTPASFTNNNSLFRDGYLWLNHEGDYDSLYKVFYDDFTDTTEYFIGIYSSLGSIDPIGENSEIYIEISTTTAETGTLITFESAKIYNSPISPATGDITDDLTGAKIGIVQKIYHKSGTEPTYPAGWVLIGTGTYVTGTILNIIFAEWISETRVEYWIIQEA